MAGAGPPRLEARHAGPHEGVARRGPAFVLLALVVGVAAAGIVVWNRSSPDTRTVVVMQGNATANERGDISVVGPSDDPDVQPSPARPEADETPAPEPDETLAPEPEKQQRTRSTPVDPYSAALARRRAAVASCFARQNDYRPPPGLTLLLRVSPAGKVVSTGLVPMEGEPELAECIDGVVRELAFPATGAPVNARIPLTVRRR